MFNHIVGINKTLSEIISKKKMPRTGGSVSTTQKQLSEITQKLPK